MPPPAVRHSPRRHLGCGGSALGRGLWLRSGGESFGNACHARALFSGHRARYHYSLGRHHAPDTTHQTSDTRHQTHQDHTAPLLYTLQKKGMEVNGALIAVIGDEETVTGMLLAGVGNVDARRTSNFMVVDSSDLLPP